MNPYPDSIAIAGAWGYIGRKLLDAALRGGVRAWVLDPGPMPADLAPGAFTRLTDEAEFYDLDVGLFHLALHPEARRQGEMALLERAAVEPLFILSEKPMVAPDRPEHGPQLIAAVESSQAVVLYDFPELFDPLTRRIVEFLSGFRRIDLTSVRVIRSKDREDPAIPRNYKTMVPIQFQETVHCLAYVLQLLTVLRGDLEETLAPGISVAATSDPYAPPNPDAYPYVVDGRCEFQMSLGNLAVAGLTDFKRGAPWSKHRVLQGTADGEPFIIEADYLEGKKRLAINGVDQGWDAASSSYEAILATIADWRRAVPWTELRRGAYPNPRLAWRAFQLSGVLWRSSHERAPIHLASLHALDTFASGFREALPSFSHYGVACGPASSEAEHGR